MMIIIIINAKVLTHNYFISRESKKPDMMYFVNLKKKNRFPVFIHTV